MIRFTPNQRQVQWGFEAHSSVCIDVPMRGEGKTTFLLSEVCKRMVANTSQYMFVTPLTDDLRGFHYHANIVKEMLADYNPRVHARGRKITCDGPDGVSVLMFYHPNCPAFASLSGVNGVYVDDAHTLDMYRVPYLLHTMMGLRARTAQLINRPVARPTPFVMIGDGRQQGEYPHQLILQTGVTDDPIGSEMDAFLQDQTKGDWTLRKLNAMDWVKVEEPPAQKFLFNLTFEEERDAILFKTWFSEMVISK